MKTYYWDEIDFKDDQVFINDEYYSGKDDFYSDIESNKIEVKFRSNDEYFFNETLPATNIRKLFLIIPLLLLIACSTSQNLTYRPYNESKLWNIKIEQGGFTDQIEVIINDEIIIEETPNFFTNTIDETVIYKNSEVRLLANYNSGCLGIGEGYFCNLFIDNELVSQVEF